MKILFVITILKGNNILTKIDKVILKHLQLNPTLSINDLAQLSGVTATTCWRRVEKLKSTNVICATYAEIDWRFLGYEVEVSLRVTLDKTQPRAFEEFIESARQIQQVIEIQTFLGSVDVRLSVLAKDMADYQEIYLKKILMLPNISDIEALMHIASIKSEEVLPL
jgi:Lrp/AsnC family transcriptional regulator